MKELAKTIFVAAGGFTLQLTEIDLVLKVVIGALTCAYLVLKIIQLIKRLKKH